MAAGPTTGASEPEHGAWRAFPGLALLVRVVVIAVPLLTAFVVIRLVDDHLWRPDGLVGTLVWLVQAVAVGSAASVLADRQARRLLPLATLFGMSLVFPDQAPSRFGVALRSGTVRQLRQRADRATSEGLGDDLTGAATTALEMVTGLSRHDRFTRGHTERVRAYAEVIAVELGLSERDRSLLSWGVLLHDIGKLAVPAEVLNKTEPLDDAEWAVLQRHPAVGGEMLEPLSGWLGDWTLAAAEHHERWDGDGYPLGLAGKEISLAGRIAAVADAYDVITSRRSYKAPLSPEAARRELVDCAGHQFDPEVVRALLNVSLGHRWAYGPVAGLLDLWSTLGSGIGSTATPLVATAGAVVALGSGMITPPPTTDPGPALAFEATGDDGEDAGPVATTADAGAGPAGTTASNEPTIVPATDSTLLAPELTATTAPPTTATEATTPTTPAPPTAAPTTTAAPPPTAPPTTPPTTPVPPPTAPPTTTAAPMAATDYLGLGAPGGTQPFTSIAPTGPLTDHDGDTVDGTALVATSEGLAEENTARIISWARDSGGEVLSGLAVLHLWVGTATDLGGGTVTVRAGLSDCNSQNFLGCPVPFAQAQAVTGQYVGGGFAEVVLDFGTLDHTFQTNRHLLLTVVVEGADAHLAFAAAGAPARLGLTVAP